MNFFSYSQTTNSADRIFQELYFFDFDLESLTIIAPFSSY